MYERSVILEQSDGGDVRRVGIVDERALVVLGRDPDDDDIVVALAGLGIDGVGPWAPEVDEGLAPDLVQGVVAAAAPDRDALARLGG